MAVRTGSARSERMEQWDSRWRPFLVTAAVTPVLLALLAPNLRTGVAVAIDAASWLVFMIDLVVRVRIDRRYLRSGEGLFDLAIVVLTLPWAALGVAGESRFISIFRLARLVRLIRTLRVGKAAEKLWDRLGRLASVVATSSLAAALIVVRAEPESSGFEHFGDGLWWALVSLTTVGYGDLAPVTTAGRLAAVVLMLVGLAALGTIAAALASMFADNKAAEFEQQTLAELAEIRAQLDELATTIDKRNT